MGFMDRVKGFFDLDGEEENYYAGKEQSKEPASHEQKMSSVYTPSNKIHEWFFVNRESLMK